MTKGSAKENQNYCRKTCLTLHTVHEVLPIENNKWSIDCLTLQFISKSVCEMRPEIYSLKRSLEYFKYQTAEM